MGAPASHLHAYPSFDGVKWALFLALILGLPVHNHFVSSLWVRQPGLLEDCCAQQTGVHEMVVEALLVTIYSTWVAS
jgi:hypothetical protein